VEKHISINVHYGEHMFRKMNILTSTSTKVLSFLLFNPMEQFYGRELARQVGVSVGATNQFLRRFCDLGLVEMEKRGRTNLYRANLRNPVSRQFKVLLNVVALNDLVNDIKDFSERVILFGSCASGTDTKDSDIDLFILTSDAKPLQRRISQYSQELEREIAPIIMNPTELARLILVDKPLYERIQKGITLWEQE
jgi:predicted nucleotidyltransferase